MSVNDENAWVRREIDWIGVPLKEDTPFLGICLGTQMLARHLGHRVRPHPHGRVEVGYYPILRRNTGIASAIAGSPTMSTNGTGKVSICRAGQLSSPKARISRHRPSVIARRPTDSNSIQK